MITCNDHISKENSNGMNENKHLVVKEARYKNDLI